MARSVRTRFALGFSTAALLASFSAGAALAGEVNGNGEETPIRSVTNSICAFSGLNDGHPPLGRKAAHVQNWGQIPKAVRDVIATQGEHPGDACNGHTGFLAGGN